MWRGEGAYSGTPRICYSRAFVFPMYLSFFLLSGLDMCLSYLE